jgi:heme exporter protein D
VIAQMLSAGKYAAYVWPAYGVSALGMVWMIVDSLARARHWRREAERLEREDAV